MRRPRVEAAAHPSCCTRAEKAYAPRARLGGGTSSALSSCPKLMRFAGANGRAGLPSAFSSTRRRFDVFKDAGLALRGFQLAIVDAESCP